MYVCVCGGFGAFEWTSLLMPLRINQPQAKHTTVSTLPYVPHINIVTVVSIYA